MPPRGSLVSHIYGHLKQRTGRELRQDRMFHPSDLAGSFCPRRWILQNFHPDAAELYAESVQLEQARRFAHGHAVHHKLQAILSESGILWGQWKEPETPDHEHWGFGPPEKGLTYAEVPVFHGPDRITGRIDGLIRLDGKFGLEIKSVNAYRATTIGDEPFDHHREQVLIYMHCLAWMHDQKLRGIGGQRFVDAFDRERVEGFIVLYENTDSLVLKECRVEYDAYEVAELIGAKRALIQEALGFEQSKRLPECRCEYRNDAALCQSVGSLPVGIVVAATGSSSRAVEPGRVSPSTDPSEDAALRQNHSSETGATREERLLEHRIVGSKCAACGRSRTAIEHFRWSCSAVSSAGILDSAELASRSLLSEEDEDEWDEEWEEEDGGDWEDDDEWEEEDDWEEQATNSCASLWSYGFASLPESEPSVNLTISDEQRLARGYLPCVGCREWIHPEFDEVIWISQGYLSEEHDGEPFCEDCDPLKESWKGGMAEVEVEDEDDDLDAGVVATRARSSTGQQRRTGPAIEHFLSFAGFRRGDTEEDLQDRLGIADETEGDGEGGEGEYFHYHSYYPPDYSLSGCLRFAIGAQSHRIEVLRVNGWNVKAYRSRGISDPFFDLLGRSATDLMMLFGAPKETSDGHYEYEYQDASNPDRYVMVTFVCPEHLDGRCTEIVVYWF